jgi:hypothetical protein
MNAIRKALILPAILALGGFPCRLMAAENSNAPASNDAKLKPIEVNYTTLGGLSYSIGDEALSGYKEFEDLVLPLRDYEATRLLKRSEASEVNAKIFGTLGLAGFATGIIGVLTAPPSQQTPFWITAIGGGISIDIGGLFQSEAQTTKFNSVQRYNRFARGEEQVLPQMPRDEKSLLNFSPSKPAPTPKAKNPPK